MVRQITSSPDPTTPASRSFRRPATEAAEAGGDPEPVPNDADAVLAHLAGEDVSGGLVGRLRGLF